MSALPAALCPAVYGAVEVEVRSALQTAKAPHGSADTLKYKWKHMSAAACNLSFLITNQWKLMLCVAFLQNFLGEMNQACHPATGFAAIYAISYGNIDIGGPSQAMPLCRMLSRLHIWNPAINVPFSICPTSPTLKDSLLQRGHLVSKWSLFSVNNNATWFTVGITLEFRKHACAVVLGEGAKKGQRNFSLPPRPSSQKTIVVGNYREK